MPDYRDSTRPDEKLTISIIRPWDDFGYWVRVSAKNSSGGVFVAEPLAFREYQTGDISPPTLKIDRQECQELLNELWMHGFRPTTGEIDGREIGAVNRHLSDMRKLVEHSMGVKL